MFKTKLQAGLEAVTAVTGKKEGDYILAEDLTKINEALVEAASAIESKEADVKTIADLTAKLNEGASAEVVELKNQLQTEKDARLKAEDALEKIKADNPGLVNSGNPGDDKGHESGHKETEGESEANSELNKLRAEQGLPPIKFN